MELTDRDYKHSAPNGALTQMLQSEKDRSTTLGPISFGRTRPSSSMLLLLALSLLLFGCVRRSRNMSPRVRSGEVIAQNTQTKANDQQPGTSLQPSSNRESPQRLNLNTSSANELETLPGIGKGLAERIVEHRARYGPFRRPEHLIVVRGISDRRFRALRDLIRVE